MFDMVARSRRHGSVWSCAVPAALTAAALGGWATIGSGQALASGARVRVRIAADAETPAYDVVGRLVRLTGDTVVISPENGVVVPIVLNAQRHLQVRVSSRGHGGTGAKLGVLWGAVTGGISAAATWQPCTPAPGFLGGLSCAFHPSRGAQATGGAILGAGGGALLGFAIGSLIRTETWIPVRKGGLTIALTPAGAGISIALP